MEQKTKNLVVIATAVVFIISLGVGIFYKENFQTYSKNQIDPTVNLSHEETRCAELGTERVKSERVLNYSTHFNARLRTCLYYTTVANDPLEFYGYVFDFDHTQIILSYFNGENDIRATPKGISFSEYRKRADVLMRE